MRKSPAIQYTKRCLSMPLETNCGFDCECTANFVINGGADGTRTRDLRRDRMNVSPQNQPETVDEKETWETWVEQFENVPA